LHQKAKHFKCERCGRRLNTAGGKYRDDAMDT
jgi:ribosomal protein L37E